MTKLFIVTMSTTTGPFGPTTSMTYHRSLADANGSFTDCQNSLSDDPSTILLVEVDLETLQETIIESWEGTMDDYDDEIGARYEADEEE